MAFILTGLITSCTSEVEESLITEESMKETKLEERSCLEIPWSSKHRVEISFSAVKDNVGEVREIMVDASSYDGSVIANNASLGASQLYFSARIDRRGEGRGTQTITSTLGDLFGSFGIYETTAQGSGLNARVRIDGGNIGLQSATGTLNRRVFTYPQLPADVRNWPDLGTVTAWVYHSGKICY